MGTHFIRLYDDQRRRYQTIRADKIVSVAENSRETCYVTWEAGTEANVTHVAESATAVQGRLDTILDDA